MRAEVKWLGDMQFTSECGGNSVSMDAKAPLGRASAMTPKELLASGLAGCTAMDVVSLLKKHKQGHESLIVEVELESSSGIYPQVFVKGHLTYNAQGNIDPKVLLDSVNLSQTKYCGVSAMLAKAFPITYEVILNGEKIG